MTRPSARPALLACLALGAALALAPSAPLAAQQTFDLPPASPSPTPAPAGPADERAGVAIPPRVQPDPAPTAVIQPLPAPSPARRAPLALPLRPAGRPVAAPAPLAPAAEAGPAVPSPAPGSGPLALPTSAPTPAPTPAPTVTRSGAAPADDGGAPDDGSALPALPEWWPFAAGGLGALVLLAGGAWLWRRRKPKVLHLAAPVAGTSPEPGTAGEPPRLDLALDITAATRSLMMFTLEYRLTIANRSERAVNDLNLAAKLACARAGGGSAAGAAQGLQAVARIGPHQARSITGTLQLPLAAVTPLRQGQTAMFIPLVHVTLEGDGLAADTKTFVIGTPSASGRVHPILLDQPPGGIAGLVAQAIRVPPASAAA